jgi:hypothetical protein
MNPYTKTNFGNTHIMIVNAHCLRGTKCNTYLKPKNPHWLWVVNALFTYGYENYKEILNMKYPCQSIKLLSMLVYLMKLDALSISNN